MESMSKNVKEQAKLSVATREQLRVLYRELDFSMKTIRKLIGDPRSVVRACKDCGEKLTARQMRQHKCKVRA